MNRTQFTFAGTQYRVHGVRGEAYVISNIALSPGWVERHPESLILYFPLISGANRFQPFMKGGKVTDAQAPKSSR